MITIRDMPWPGFRIYVEHFGGGLYSIFYPINAKSSECSRESVEHGGKRKKWALCEHWKGES